MCMSIPILKCSCLFQWQSDTFIWFIFARSWHQFNQFKTFHFPDTERSRGANKTSFKLFLDKYGKELFWSSTVTGCFRKNATKVTLYCSGCIPLRKLWDISFFHWQWDILVQACLRAPPVVVDEANLAIVFTYLLDLSVQLATVFKMSKYMKTWKNTSENYKKQILFFSKIYRAQNKV